MKNKYADEVPMDDYEKELAMFLDKGIFEDVDNFAKEKKEAEQAAERYFDLKQNKSVTLRVKNANLIRIKAKAKKNNLPYQTLINMLINGYLDGKFKLAI